MSKNNIDTGSNWKVILKLMLETKAFQQHPYQACFNIYISILSEFYGLAVIILDFSDVYNMVREARLQRTSS